MHDEGVQAWAVASALTPCAGRGGCAGAGRVRIGLAGRIVMSCFLVRDTGADQKVIPGQNEPDFWARDPDSDEPNRTERHTTGRCESAAGKCTEAAAGARNSIASAQALEQTMWLSANPATSTSAAFTLRGGCMQCPLCNRVEEVYGSDMRVRRGVRPYSRSSIDEPSGEVSADVREGWLHRPSPP